jgi:F-type H+-transporting ATPase subunit gamma
MRALSRTRLRQAQRAFGNFLLYAHEVERALGRGLSLVPGEPATRAGSPGAGAIFVLGTEHGFVGGLNEHVLDRARSELARQPNRAVFFAGSRLARAARERGLAGESQLRLATTVAGFERTARALTDLVATRLLRGELGPVVVIGPRRQGPSGWEVASDRIFPVPRSDAGPSREPPLHYLPSRVLVAKLLEEFLFSRIAGAVAEAFLSEQLARVHAMDATLHNLDDKLEDLEKEERLKRQEVITSELLEVVAGAEALAVREAPASGPP